MLFGFMGANAAGTVAGTLVNNSATLSYTVGTVSQTAIVSNTDSFIVDNKIDLTVAHQDATIVAVTPGATVQVLTFEVTNTGNKVQDFLLTQTLNDGNPYAGETDNFDATTVQVFVDVNGNGVYDTGTDTATFIDELAPDAAVTVFIVSNIPTGQVNNDVSDHTLTAQVAVGGAAGQGAAIATDDSANADTAMGEEIVFADGDGAGATEGANDGMHADHSAYKVVSAALAVVKSSCVLSDPVNAGTNPKRIPGAIIRYEIQIANTGSAAATVVSLADAIATQYGTSAANLEVRTAACAGIDGGTNACATKAGTVETNAGTGGAGTSNVTLDYATVAAGATECGYIEVTIQ